MKKLNIRTEITRGNEILTRAQLKQVLGGSNKNTACGGSHQDFATCYNCCIGQNSVEFCANNCAVD